jgi:hypothetical protein
MTTRRTGGAVCHPMIEVFENQFTSSHRMPCSPKTLSVPSVANRPHTSNGAQSALRGVKNCHCRSYSQEISVR